MNIEIGLIIGFAIVGYFIGQCVAEYKESKRDEWAEKRTLKFLIKQLKEWGGDGIFKIYYCEMSEVWFIKVEPDELMNDYDFRAFKTHLFCNFMNGEYAGLLSFVNSESLYEPDEGEHRYTFKTKTQHQNED